MRSRFVLVLCLVSPAIACSSSPTSTSSSPSPSTVARAQGTAFLSQTPTRFARKVARSTHAAALRAPWVSASASSTPASAPPSTEAASTKYPAFVPDAPQVIDGGAPTLANMKIVTLTWNDDPLAGALEAFGDGIGATPYWKAIHEYGIGPAQSGYARHFRGANFPATITDVELDALVQSSVQDPASGWPANAPQQTYAIYLPPTTTFLVDNGDGTTTPACQEFGGYHTATYPTGPDGGPTGASIVYSVVPRCPGFGIDTVTLASSHELSETASDSFATGGNSYVGFDNDHLAYDIYQSFQDEIGDACEFFEASGYEAAPPFTFNVQRNWSNKSASAGHNPCVPLITGEAYYNTTTLPGELDTINVDFTPIAYPGSCSAQFPCTEAAKGLKLALGASRTFEVGFYSDAPTADWTLQAFALPTMPISDPSGNAVLNGSVAVRIDQPTGNNGHKARVTVTPLTAGALGLQYIELQSGYGQYDEAHTLPILISQK